MNHTSENKPDITRHLSVGMLAHVDAGKTTLTEALLYLSGALRRLGRVDNGDAFLDTFAIEKERGITIFSKQALLSWSDTCVTLLDTPGHVDFSAEMERTLQVLDYAILVISAADGVQGHTQTLWHLLEQYQIPVFLFVNKMDQPGTDRRRCMEELRERLGAGCVDFSQTDSEEFYENAALCDEHLLDSFLASGRLETEELRQGIAERKIFPCFFGSALKMQGVEEFFRGLQKYTCDPVYPEEFGAKVFKIARDEKGNRLTYVKITGGTLAARMTIRADGWEEKVNQIRLYSGSRFETIAEAPAGTVCVLTGLTQTRAGAGLGKEKTSKAPFLEPVLTYQLQLPEGCEAAVFLPKLRMLEEEEPELHVLWHQERQEIQIQVMGEVQIEILKRMIAERFGIETTFGTGSIVYKETITKAVEGVGHFEPLRHYAEVHLWLEPGDPGSGVTLASDCSEDMLDKNWQRLILTHLGEKEHRGVLTGAGITDIRITLVAGRAHNKHTEGGDFRQATYRAVRQGLMQAESILLEPYYEFRLEVPDTAAGRAMTDIDRMQGKFEIRQGQDGNSVLTGTAPAAKMRDYRKEVTAYTKGHGRLHYTPAGYYPCHNAEEVLAQSGYDPERDTENPSGSVFCSHGAGFHVSWEHVKEYMHIESAVKQKEKGQEKTKTVQKRKAAEEWIDIEEIDQILTRTAYANRKNEPISHKGISAKRLRQLTPAQTGSAKTVRKREIGERYLLVDGYNIIFAWEELRQLAKENIDAARGRLMDILCNYQGFKKCRLILVFDAYRIRSHPTEVTQYHNIYVVYTKEAETADQYIEKFAHENAKKYHITVATSDGLEQIIIRGEGCRLMSATELEREIAACGEELKEYMKDSE